MGWYVTAALSCRTRGHDSRGEAKPESVATLSGIG